MQIGLNNYKENQTNERDRIFSLNQAFLLMEK